MPYILTFFIRASLIFVSKIRGKLQSPKNSFYFQAPECLSGVLQRRFPLKTTNDSIPLLQVDRFVTLAQSRDVDTFLALISLPCTCVFPKSSHFYVQNIFSTFHYNQKQKKPRDFQFLDFLQTLCHEHSLLHINWCVNMKHIYC